jgi:hypothetical protein
MNLSTDMVKSNFRIRQKLAYQKAGIRKISQTS